VLVVDQDQDTREMYCRACEIAGYRARPAASLEAALALADDDPPDVALCEWRLPDGDGLELARGLKARPSTRNVTLVAVTATSLPELDQAGAAAQGFDRVLLKPALPDRVVEVVQEIVRQRAARQLRAAAEQTARCAALVRPDALTPSRAGTGLFQKAASIIDRAASRICGPVALLLADDRGRYLAASDGASELTGYDHASLRQLSVWDLTPGARLDEALRMWTAFIVAGTQEGTFVLQRRDGSRVLVQYHAIANVAPGLHVSAIAQAPGSMSQPSIR
jgi:CheY-like chemotaxis protein